MPPFGALLLALPLAAAPVDKSSKPSPREGDGVVLTLRNGGSVEGVFLRQEDGTVWLAADGGELAYGPAQIARLRVRPNTESEFRRRFAALESARAGKLAPGPGDAGGFVALGDWADEKGLGVSAGEAYRRAVQIDPDEPTARERLGYERVNGLWMTRAQALQARGYVRDGDEWITRREHAEREAARRAQEQDELNMYASRPSRARRRSAPVHYAPVHSAPVHSRRSYSPSSAEQRVRWRMDHPYAP